MMPAADEVPTGISGVVVPTPQPNPHRLVGWLLLLPLFALYALSFRDVPIIDRKHSVLADADAANFKLLVENFGLSRKMGDEYNAVNRGIGDNAQKHKIHHVLYAITARPVYLALRTLARMAGGTGERAIYSVNAVFTCVNIVLLVLVLSGMNPQRNPVFPFVALYAFSLSTWLYASVPESWPFSGGLVLMFLLVLQRNLLRPLPAAVLIGVIMLNNVALGSLLVLLWLRLLRNRRPWHLMVAEAAFLGLVALTTWLAGLTLLGLFDPSLAPANFIRYTLWFRQFVAAGLSPFSSYVWKSVLTNLFVNSVASHQADPSIPQEALKYTLQQSALGTVAVLSVVAFYGLTAVRLVDSVRQRVRSLGWWTALADDPALWPSAFAGVMVAVTIALYYGSGFLYSTTVLPLVMLTAARFLDWRRMTDRVAVWGMLVLVVVNNASQVLIFRHALGPLR